MDDLTDERAVELRSLLEDEIGEFGYTRDVTPRDWVALEIAAVREVRRKVLAFETGGRDAGLDRG